MENKEKNIPKFNQQKNSYRVMTTYRFRAREKRFTSDLWQYISQSTGNTRFVYNHFLNVFNLHFKQQKEIKKQLVADNLPLPEGFKTFLSYPDLCKLLTQLKSDPNYSWLKKSYSQTQQKALQQLNEAMTEYALGKKGKPTYRKKGISTESCRFPQIKKEAFDFRKQVVTLPGCPKEPVPVRFHRTWSERENVKNVTLKKEPDGKIYICVQTEYIMNDKEQEKLNKRKTVPLKEDNIIGLDAGVSKFITDSKGNVFHWPEKMQKKLKQNAEKITQLQKGISHKEEVRKKRQEKYIKLNPGKEVPANLKYRSKNSIKKQKRLRRCWNKVTNMKQDYRHKLSDYLSKNHTMIIMEDLDVVQMTMSKRRYSLLHDKKYQEKLKEKKKVNKQFRYIYDKRKLNRGILSMGWGILGNMLSYKAKRNNGNVIKINPAYTSQMCSTCGHVSPENRKTQSQFLCTCCGYKANADKNAAINIKTKSIFHLKAEGYVIQSEIK